MATTAVVGLLLGLDLVLGLAGAEAYRRPFGVSLSLIAAVIGGGRVIYLALAALLQGRVGADIALAVACVAAGLMGEFFVAAEVVFIALVRRVPRGVHLRAGAAVDPEGSWNTGRDRRG